MRGATLWKHIPEYWHRTPLFCSVAINVKHEKSQNLCQNSTFDITYVSYIRQWSMTITKYHMSEYYAASSGNFLSTFRDNLSVASSSVKTTFLDSWRWNRYDVPKRRQEITTTRFVITQKRAVLIYLEAETWNYAPHVCLLFHSPNFAVHIRSTV